MIVIHVSMLIKILIIAIVLLPVLKSSTVSKLKVENVLKPPQNPTNTSNLIVGLTGILVLNKNSVSAIIKQLMVFDKNVAKGKFVLKFVCTNIPIAYLNTLPTPPPKNTNSKLFMY